MTICETDNLCVEYKVRGKIFARPDVLSAVHHVSIAVEQGETYGLVGESGCGKSTLANAILGFEKPSSGSIRFAGHTLHATTSRREIAEMRRHMQIVFQDPYSSLNPRFEVWQLITEPMSIAGERSKERLKSRALELLLKVGLSKEDLNRNIFEFSGGQRQRIAIARALSTAPDLLVCDEPVSALDVSVHSQICNLLMDLQNELGLTYLFISHNLSVIKHITTHMAVMYLGQVVETGRTDCIFARAAHPYTQALISAILEIKPGKNREKILLSGEVTSPINAGSGCRFYSRCRISQPGCRTEPIRLREVEQGHYTACPYAMSNIKN